MMVDGQGQFLFQEKKENKKIVNAACWAIHSRDVVFILIDFFSYLFIVLIV
jgi:hypothetical protein